MPGKRLEGKVALITGGGSGFGRECAQRFAEEGAKIFIGDINENGLKETASKIDKADEIVLQQKFDVTKQDEWEKAVDAIDKKWGRLDIVINNAGTSYRNKPTADVTQDEFDRVFNINVKSIFLSVKVCIPHLKKAGGGSMINISSIGSVRPRPGLVWYNSSKSAVSNATKGLAAEYGPDQIRVNALCPLLSNTGLFETFVGVPHTEENLKQFVAQVPLGRLTKPVDVANAAIFLSSEEGSFCNGICMEIDGGKGI